MPSTQKDHSIEFRDPAYNRNRDFINFINFMDSNQGIVSSIKSNQGIIILMIIKVWRIRSIIYLLLELIYQGLSVLKQKMYPTNLSIPMFTTGMSLTRTSQKITLIKPITPKWQMN